MRTSEVYKATCKPDVKALQAMYDNGFEVMTAPPPPPPPPPFVAKAESADHVTDPLRRLVAGWHG